MGLVAPWHVGSSQTRARTRVPCIGRQILNHCATREAPYVSIFKELILALLALASASLFFISLIYTLIYYFVIYFLGVYVLIFL